jgi:aspartyl-tRNA synthetase
MAMYVDLRSFTDEHIGKSIFTRGRIHNIRVTGNLGFIILRYQMHSLQIVASKKVIGIDNFNILKGLTLESVIECHGHLRKSPVEIKFTSYNSIEMDLQKCNIVSIARPLPFQIDDANDLGETFRSDVKSNTKMEHRWIDLRTPINNCIFKIQSAIVQYFKEYFLGNNFIEIHSPKLIGAASEGGAQVFELKYFDKQAFLAQSPQLYKQMAINSDFDRVFEIGPVFRAEHALTSRHMCEFTGLDFEMTIGPENNYREVQNMLWNLLIFIFDNLKNNYRKEIDYIKNKIPFEDPIYPQEPLILTFKECVDMLRIDGKVQDDYEDLNTENERRVGEIVKDKYGSDLFIIDQYPASVRPFYTMQSPTNPKYSNSYDVIFKCTEISSGSQREHKYDTLMSKVNSAGIDPNTLKYYLESFSHGSIPHGGAGIGAERIVSLFLNLGNVKLASFCPRDPKRLFP